MVLQGSFSYETWEKPFGEWRRDKALGKRRNLYLRLCRVECGLGWYLKNQCQNMYVEERLGVSVG